MNLNNELREEMQRQAAQKYFTKFELVDINSALSAQILHAVEAIELLHDASAADAIYDYIERLQALNSKICRLMEG